MTFINAQMRQFVMFGWFFFSRDLSCVKKGLKEERPKVLYVAGPALLGVGTDMI